MKVIIHFGVLDMLDQVSGVLHFKGQTPLKTAILGVGVLNSKIFAFVSFQSQNNFARKHSCSLGPRHLLAKHLLRARPPCEVTLSQF